MLRARVATVNSPFLVRAVGGSVRGSLEVDIDRIIAGRHGRDARMADQD